MDEAGEQRGGGTCSSSAAIGAGQGQASESPGPVLLALRRPVSSLKKPLLKTYHMPGTMLFHKDIKNSDEHDRHGSYSHRV